MKPTKYFIIFLMLCMVQTSFGQNENKKNKRIEAIKVAYLTSRLDLTSEESQNFWPVYNKYQNEIFSINQQKKQNRLQNANNPGKLVDTDLDFDTKILDCKKKYRVEFGKILTAEKVKRLYVAERDFREELIKQLKNRSEYN